MHINLPQYIKKAISVIKENNKEAYVVGGCVRDSILGKIPYDWDITTNMVPEEIKQAFSKYKIVDRNGEKHGTVAIMIDENIIEITTYRSDLDYLDGRHPWKIEFVTSLETDLVRRDFTINALAYNDEEGLIDLTGGIKDIDEKRIKCIGKAVDRFNEDYLRILRALRFSSTLGFELDEETTSAIHMLKEKLKTISSERIKKELEGILTGKDIFRVLCEFKDVFGIIIPELVKCFNFDQKSKYHRHDVYMHTCYVVSNTKPDFITRMAALLHDIGKPTSYTEEFVEGMVRRHFYGHAEASCNLSKVILKRLKFSNEEIFELLYLIKHHDVKLTADKKMIRRQMSKTPENSLQLFCYLLDLKQADRKDHINYDEEIDFEEIKRLAFEIKEENECLSIKDLDVDGNDMMKIGIHGKKIKEALNNLLQLVIEEEIENKKDKLLVKAKEMA